MTKYKSLCKALRYSAVLLGFAAVALPGHAQMSVGKTATDSSGTPLTPSSLIAPSTLIKYRTNFAYTGNSFLPTGQFVDQMSSGQNYVINSMVAPSDWTQTSPVFSGTNQAMMLTGPIFPNGSLGQLIDVNTSITSTVNTLGTGGDGLVPIVDAAGTHVYVVHHHANGSAAKILCYSLADGSACAGYGSGLQLRSSAAGLIDDIFTGGTSEQFIVGSKIYYTALKGVDPVVTGSTSPRTAGMGCFDALTATNCAFISSGITLNLPAPTGSNATIFAEMAASRHVGADVYLNVSGAVRCFTLSTGVPCAGFVPPVSLPQPATGAGAVGTNYNMVGINIFRGKYLVYSIASTPTQSTARCFDVQTSSVCAGAWPVTTANYVNAAVPLGAAVVETGFCLASTTIQIAGPLPCFDFAGAAATNPIPKVGLTVVPTGNVTVPGTQKVIYPVFSPVGGAAHCFDYATNSPCSGFTDIDNAPGIREWSAPGQNGNPGVSPFTGDYGYSYSNGCVYALGDAGLLWSFDPLSGNSPCVSGTATFTNATPSNQYCDGLQHVTAWTALTISNVSAQVYNATITVRDATNTVTIVPSKIYSVTSGKIIVDLSGVSYQTYPTLNIDIVLASDAIPAGTPPAIAVLTFASDRADQDICYAATAPSNCAASTLVTNDAQFNNASGNLIAVAPPVATSTHATQAVCQGPQISILKQSTTKSYPPGVASAITYTVDINNASTVATANNLSLTDPAPTGITIDSWTCPMCSPTSGGAGNISAAIATLAPNGGVTLTISGTVSASSTGTLINTATVTPPINGNCVNGICSSSAAITTGASISASKTSMTNVYAPNTATPITYTITVSNSTATASTATSIVDNAPIGLTIINWTCTACVTSSGNGNVATTANVPGNGSVSITVHATILGTTTGAIVNTANITTTPPDSCTSVPACTPIFTVTPAALISAVKTNSLVGPYQVGAATPITYTITVSNSTATASTATSIVDNAPAGVTFIDWTCAACITSSGTGNVATTANVPGNGSVVITVHATILGTATGAIVNTATITTTPPDACVSVPSCTPTSTVGPAAIISATKTVSVDKYKVGDATPITYTITVNNTSQTTGSVATQISDSAPAGITFGAWTCPSCNTASGNGNVVTSANIPANGSVTVVVSATITKAATKSIVNVATITPTAPDVCNTPTNCTPSATVDPQTIVTRLQNVPTMTENMLILLAALIGITAAFASFKSERRNTLRKTTLG